MRLADDSDRAAFRAWFVLLADAQFDLVKVIAPGQFRAVPAQISPMYVPGVHASSEPQMFVIAAPAPGTR